LFALGFPLIEKMSLRTSSSKVNYETVPATERTAQGPAGLPGSLLYRLDKTILLNLFAIVVYAVAGFCFAIYLASCPWESTAIKVLQTKNLKVDQFYCSLALSFVMTPAAIIIRKIAVELALLHPFALASKKPVKMSDLDTLMDPGLWSALNLFKYSFFDGIVQVFLLVVGATLVPVGTLLVYTGTYSAPLPGTAVVGLPTYWYNMMIMDIDMNEDFGSSQNNTISSDNFFADLAIDMFKGNIIRQTGVITSTSQILGPVATTNLTYEEDVRYDGIVTYEWSSGCQYTDSIIFTEATEPYEWIWNVTFPNGEEYTGQDAWESRLLVANTSSNGSDITIYYATLGTVQETVNMDAALAESGITVSNGSWISCIVCNPTFNWKMSNCLWKNSSITDCYDAPGSNTTVLDVEGLDELQSFFSAIPLMIYDAGSYTYGLQTLQTALMFDPQATNDHQYRAPLLLDFNNMYGLLAQSLAVVTTAGYYGTAEVPTIGSPPKPVYLVRTYVLALVVLALILSPLLTISILLLNLRNHMPLRKATLLTVANAVRGPRWDAAFFGGCVMPHQALKKSFERYYVMFGVDYEFDNHVGFASIVYPVQRDSLYVGVEANE
jgi:hypothetical protein